MIKCIILFVLCFISLSVIRAQTINTTEGENSPIIFAQNVATTYGVKPTVVQAVIDLYSKSGLNKEQRQKKVETLIKNYSILPVISDTLTNQQKQSLGVSSNYSLISALNFDRFFKTSGKNSPIVYAPDGKVNIWYGIAPDAVRSLWGVLENEQMDYETAQKAFQDLLKKYNELKKQADALGHNPQFSERIAKAKQLIDNGKLEEATEELAKIDNESSKSTAEIKELHASALEAQYRYKEATPLRQDITRLVPEDLDYKLKYATNLVYVSNLDLAISEFKKLNVLIYDKNDTLLANSYNNLGLAWLEKGILDSAIAFYEKALEINEKIYGEVDTKIAVTNGNLGTLWLNKDPVKATSYFEKEISVDLKFFGEENLNIANDYINLGTAYHLKGDISNAISYYRKALKIDLKIYGKEEPHISIDYNHLGATWQDIKNLDSAFNYFNRALAIDLKYFGEEDVNTATDYQTLGGAWEDKKNLDSAINYFNKALIIDVKLLGEDNTSTAIDYNNLGWAWKEKGDLDKAISYGEKSYSIFRKLYGEDNPSMKTVKENLDLYKALKEKLKGITPK
ncbi:MAG TPA: tetratricopeptide repeat-containing protein [Chitinophagales bacterium]|nr:tetratricopeptide repeat-containing protein [Chitinophagales bacterium]